MAKSIAYNVDCMDYMRALPDKAFDLAVVDPPYGGGGRMNTLPEVAASAACSTGIKPFARTGGTWAAKYAKKL